MVCVQNCIIVLKTLCPNSNFVHILYGQFLLCMSLFEYVSGF